MASKNTIIETIAAIKTIYSYYAKDANVELLVNTWEAVLKPFPDELVKKSLYLCLQTNKTPPTPADIIEKINMMEEMQRPTGEELWCKFIKALPKVADEVYCIRYPNYNETSDDARKRLNDIWEAMPEEIKSYIGDKNEMIRFANSYDDEELKFERIRFLKAVPKIQKRLFIVSNKLLSS